MPFKGIACTANVGTVTTDYLRGRGMLLMGQISKVKCEKEKSRAFSAECTTPYLASSTALSRLVSRAPHAVLVAAVSVATQVSANPLDGNVVAGAADITNTSPTQLSVTQYSDKVIISPMPYGSPGGLWEVK